LPHPSRSEPQWPAHVKEEASQADASARWALEESWRAPSGPLVASPLLLLASAVLAPPVPASEEPRMGLETCTQPVMSKTAIVAGSMGRSRRMGATHRKSDAASARMTGPLEIGLTARKRARDCCPAG
jgi:hypothetical protein